MKKLITAAAIVCVAAGLQAAQFNWSFETDDDMGSYTVGDSATYYLVNGDSGLGATLATVLADEGTDAFTTALGSYAYTSGTLSSGAADGVFYDAAGNYAAIFIMNDGLSGGTDFAYSEYDVSANLYTPPSSKDGIVMSASDYGDPDYASAWGADTIKGGGTPVPEPTSGLLTLLGMAGLALKRKRA